MIRCDYRAVPRRAAPCRAGKRLEYCTLAALITLECSSISSAVHNDPSTCLHVCKYLAMFNYAALRRDFLDQTFFIFYGDALLLFEAFLDNGVCRVS